MLKVMDRSDMYNAYIALTKSLKFNSNRHTAKEYSTKQKNIVFYFGHKTDREIHKQIDE